MKGLFRGKKVADKTLDNARLAIDQTTGAAVDHAKKNHSFTNRTGTLERGIAMRPAKVEGKAATGQFGVYGVDYGPEVELGTSKMPARPFVRPAHNVEAPKLAGRIKKLNG